MSKPLGNPAARMTVFTVVLLAALGAAGYFYYQYQDLQKHPEKVAQQEIANLVERVGILIELPQGEEPQLATVTDVAKLKTEQQFFARAENGDKILLYQKAKKAILYRPSAHKIIEVGPITTEPDSPALEEATPKPTPTLTRSSTPASGD